MNKLFLIGLILSQYAVTAELTNENTSIVFEEAFGSASLGRIGDYPYPNNPLYDRAKGYLLKGKVQNAVSNHGNFVTWDYHPAGFWGETAKYGYLPHLSFVAGVPGHDYSSQFSWELLQTANLSGLWYSTEAYNTWFEDKFGIVDPGMQENDWNYKTIIYNTVLDAGGGNVSQNDRGKIALRVTGYCTGDIIGNENPNEEECVADGLLWHEASIGDINNTSDRQWLIDHVLSRVYIYLPNGEDPNNVTSGIGLAFPWSIRPKFKSRTDASGGFYFDLYEYGDDLEEWTEDDIYSYYGATFTESWFFEDTPFGTPTVKSDWQATTDARYNSHNLDHNAGDLFGNTQYTDPDDPDPLLAHSGYQSTWPKKYSFDYGYDIPTWPGWWADEYYGDTPELWPSLGLSQCDGTRSDEGCWKPLPGRHISDMDVYMEFDDRWANVGNRVENNQYVSAGYPMGLKVKSMAHSYGVAYAEDVMFVTVKVRNESGMGVVFERDINGYPIPVLDNNNDIEAIDGMILPDGTKLNHGLGFDYKKVYLGFYMDADVLSTDATGGTSVHSNSDDFMQYIDCKISPEYPEGCPADPTSEGDTLRISMAIIGDYDGRSNTPSGGYSMQTGENEGPDFGMVAVQLLDSPYSTDYVDLNQDGFTDIYPGEKLKMTDWHWFDWFNRPGVVSASGSSAPALNKELIQYQVIAGDNTNLTVAEKVRYFHTADPETDYESDLNNHFDSLEGLKNTSFFQDDEDGLDCVLEMSTGPFDIDVGEQVSFSFAVIFGQNIDDLLRNAYFAQIMYNSHYQGYTPPNPPNVMAVPGHNKVELYWDDSSLESRDVITGYSDFEGYKIYRSIDRGNTWGNVDDEIIISDQSVGWHPLSIGCFDNPDEDGGGSCSNAYFLTQSSCTLAGWIWTFTPYVYGSDCSSYKSKKDCIYSNPSTFKRRDYDNDNIDDCFWQYAQFDLSAYDDSTFCIFGTDDDISCVYKKNCNCITNEDCNPCIRGADVQGPDPMGPWFNLGYNTGFDNAMLDPDNPDSVLVMTNYTTNESIAYRYKFVDHTVTDGIEYTYSVVAYDRGVPTEVVTYIPTDDGDTSFTYEVTSVPDPLGWGEINPFQILESPKGTTIHDPNYLIVTPGYMAQNNLDNIKVVPNPYIVHAAYNETLYLKKLRFTRLPPVCTITIFTISGEKVRELNHNNSEDGNEWWDLRSFNNQEVAPGLYIYVVETPSGVKKIDKFAVVR